MSASTPRYETLLRLASGGMATVWIGTARGALGFRQLVAIKKPHPHLLVDPGFRNELIAEARLASMIRHANVVDVRDVEIDGEEISLVMDFIEGASVGDLLVAASKAGSRIPPRAALRIACDACAGLHAAHELVDEKDRPVGLVHRDISPQNVLVGTDGIARVTDFGIAKFFRKDMQSTSEGSLKGKLAYMATEYLRGEPIDRRFDVFAMGVVLWEMLAGKRCFRGDNEADTLRRLLEEDPAPLASFDPALAPLDPVVACALAKNRAERFQNAAAMAAALEGAASAAGLLGTHTEVAAALKDLVGPALEERRRLVKAKLAHEPSVASMMGVSPLDLPPAIGAIASKPDAPATTAAAAGPEPLTATTLRDAPPVETPIVRAASTLPTGSPNTKAASTPKMGGGGGGGGGGSAAPSALLAGAPVPTTLPMTPAVLPIPVTTLPSATPVDAPPPVTPPVIAFVEVPGGRTLRSEDGPAALENTGPTGDAAFARSSFPLPPPPRRSLAPVIVGALAVVGIGVGVLVVRARGGDAAPPSVTSAGMAPASASGSAAVSANPTKPEPGASAVVVAGTATVSPSTSTSTSTRGKPKVVPVLKPPPSPSPSVAPPATTRKPPDNPYM